MASAMPSAKQLASGRARSARVKALTDFRSRSAAVSHESKRRMRRTSQDPPARAVPLPQLTSALADAFIKIVNAGIPALTAVAYCASDVPYERHPIVLAAWLNDPLLLKSAADFNGGEWQDLAPDDRLDIALDKHFAELAYYLWSHNYASAEGVELTKAIEARKAIVEKLKGVGEGDDTPFVKAMRDLVSGAISEATPPQLGVVPVASTKGN